MSSSTLTDEQRARIAKNREEGLRRAAARKERERITAAGPPPPSSSAIPPPARPPVLNTIQQSKPPVTCSTVASTSTEFKAPPNATYPIFNRNNNQARPPLTSTNAKPAYRPPTIQAEIPKSKITATFSLISANKVKVVFHPYHDCVRDAIKCLKSRTYDEKTRSWVFDLEEVRQAQSNLYNIKQVNVKVEPIPEAAITALTNFKLEAVPEDLSAAIDPSLIGALFPYQKEGVRYGLARGGRVLIADEMGLGKSVQALAIARYYRAEWPLMIVCPSSVKAAWKHQLNTFMPYVQKIYIVEKGTDPLPDSRTSNTVVIMSYDLMTLKQKELENKSYFVLVWDECHLLKDSKAKRTKAAISLSKKATRVIMLSGTPALSRPAELHSQIRIVNDRLFPNYQNFAIRYCDGKQGRFCFEAKGCTNSEELSAILSQRIMIRRLKNDVLKDLPDKRREVVYLTGSSIDSRMHSLQKAKAAFEATNKDSNTPLQGHESLLEYFSMTGIVKAAAVCEHILDNYFHQDSPSRKVLIFGHHQIVLDSIQVEVHKRNLRSIRIDGSTPAKERGQLCKSFQEDPDVVVAILSMTAAGVGITLTAANVVVFAELHWNPGMLMQAEDRAHRVGQKDCVFVQYLIARNTADDYIWPLIQRKMDVLGLVNLSSDSFRDADSTHMSCNTPLAKRRRIQEDVVNID